VAPEPHDLICELLDRLKEKERERREKKIKERVGGGSALLSSMVAPCFL